ncbi:hypothetical protein Afil01_61510 [Actinorhabdospora filicis]|uniref:AB hydrolase-1 domain-containing protein n=1 Tax=Actinorhabdospora filicis TaxID=1785913 RepID=A0A9W6SR06_9ACTN|nr:alpha/beta fold hydrolase [Actinorhabdospora filicis]GLZ81344.1 hypothetical protein Afil01_61510 [Actinorhabdospora filicis]
MPEILELADPSRPALDGGGDRPVRVHLFRGDGPTVVVSHGTGGAAIEMRWMTEALAEAGFTVASIDHHGNNYVDGYIPEAFVWWWDRARDFSFALDHLGASGPVGAAGFSIGGYTAATLLGARVDAGAFQGLIHFVSANPGAADHQTPEYPNLTGELLAKYSIDEALAWADAASGDYADPRVTAGFLVCPAQRPFMSEASLKAIGAPVEVRWAGADTVTPPDEVRGYAEAIPGAAGSSAGDDVKHSHFFGGKPAGEAVRARVAGEAVSFFRRVLH